MKKIWDNLPISKKLLLEIVFTAIALFASNMLIYFQINKMVVRMDSVYSSNVNLKELSDHLTAVQNNMYKYLEVKSSSSLGSYYESEQEYMSLLGKLNTEVTDNPIQLLEKNIRKMSESYLKLTEETVQLKRGQNVEKYKSSYETALRLYRFISDDITDLNSRQFKNNSASYQTLHTALCYLEIVSSLILMIVMFISLAVMMMMTRNIVTPLTSLAHTAELVGHGNFRIKVAAVESNDELGIVTRTFNQMVESLNEYIRKIRESSEKEQAMKERELLMANHLKEAQLKYLQSQINPHFLFNSLNAGVQLADMENAEKTSVFMEKMADFFRYNVKKGMEDTTIKEEVETVNNYLYILNVRFAGDIHYESQLEEEAMNYTMPSMILQPLIENAFNHGIRNIDWEGRIKLSVLESGNEIEIKIQDNGKGISKELLKAINEGRLPETKKSSTGVGISNVQSRLALYYNKDNLFHISSEGEDQGTLVTLIIPKRKGDGKDVQNTGSR